MGTPDFMRKQIVEKLENGFDTIKLKIGAIDFAEELKLLAFIRKQFSEDKITIRVDANGAFSPKQAIEKLKKTYNISRSQIKGIGIAYQMHGLVIVDKEGKPLRKSIIWWDSRAVEIGHQGFKAIGQEKCTAHLLNSPANFTASKLKWVKETKLE